MGTDYRIFTASASLDLDVAGQELFNALGGTAEQPGVILEGTLKLLPGFDRNKPFWKGVWCFVRDHGNGAGRVVSEHDEIYDTLYALVPPSHRFSVFSKKDAWKRQGYGPVG